MDPTTLALPPLTGSHQVDFYDGKACVRRVPLFVGYIPKMDGDDERMKAYDDARMDRIMQMTGLRESGGQYPRIVLYHADPEKPEAVDPTILGRCLNLEKSVITFKHGATECHGTAIFGDMEYDQDYFNSEIRTNRKPRRSAEIWDDDLMSEVVLLDRETPARPVADTHFARRRGFAGRTVERFSRNLPVTEFKTLASASAGAYNSSIPTFPGNREDHDMADDNKDLNAKFDAFMERFDRFAKRFEKDDDDEKEKARKSTHARTDSAAPVDDAGMKLMQSQLDQARTESANTAREFRKLKFTRTVDGLKNDGYVFTEDDATTMSEDLANCADEAAVTKRVEFFKRTLKRIPVGQPLDAARHASNSNPNPAGGKQLTADQFRKVGEKAVARCANDKNLDYEKVFAEEQASALTAAA